MDDEQLRAGVNPLVLENGYPLVSTYNYCVLKKTSINDFELVGSSMDLF